MPPKISLIVAHDDYLGIGAKNRLLWHIKKDLGHFKSITQNHPIIMGRKTYQSIGKPLPKRTNIVITRDTNFKAPGCFIVNSLKKAIKFAISKDKHEIFIIGGGQIYNQALKNNLIQKLYITKVKGDFKADTFLHPYPQFKKIISQSYDSEGDYQFEHFELEKTK